MKFIYQIGRLDKGFTNRVKLKYENKSYKCPLSSMALKEHFGKNITKVILIYPVSIVFNKNVINSVEKSDFKQRLEQAICNPEKYLSNPEELFKLHPHSKMVDGFFVIHSIGEYEGIRFNSSYDDIVLQILCDMILRFLEGDKDDRLEFYIDISSGHNIYVSALLEALRHFAVVTKLTNWLNKDKRPLFSIAFSDPILSGNGNKIYELHMQPVDFKAFFSSPIRKSDIDNFNLSKSIEPEDRELKRRIQCYLERFALSFSALKNNAPLVLYHFEFHEFREARKFLEERVKGLKNRLDSSWQASPKVSKNDYLKLILSLSFYMGILEVLEKKSIKKYDDNEGIGLDEVKKIFGSWSGSIYEVFELGVNVPLLGNEIRNIEEGKDKEGNQLRDRISNSWEKLGKYLYGEGDSFSKRNFIAHAGFERTVTRIKKEANTLYISYDKDKEKEIKGCLVENL